MSSGLLDIHVLEETAARVSALSKAIDKQANVVEKLSYSAQRAAQTTGKVYPLQQLSQFRSNAAAVLKLYEIIEQTTQQVYELQEPIEQGVESLGWSEYISIVKEARRVHTSLLNQPQLQKFPQLADAALTCYERGEEKLHQYFRRLCKPVFVPVNIKADPSHQKTREFDADELKTLALLRSQLNVFPGAAKSADRSLLQRLELYFTKSIDTIFSTSSPPEQPVLQRALADRRQAVMSAAEALFSSDPNQFPVMMNNVEEMIKNETRNVNEKLSQLRSRPKPPTLGVNTQVGRSMGPSSGNPSSTNHQPRSAGGSLPTNSPNLGGARLSGDALRGPVIPGSPHSASNTRNASTPPLLSGGFQPATPSASRASVASHSNSSKHQRGSLNSQLAGSPYSPASQANSGNQPAANTPGQNGPIGANITSSACLETLESVRNHAEVPQEEIKRCKRDGTMLLTQVFQDIDTQCRKAPITSEFGVSGASIQFLKTLQSIVSNSQGVEVVLSELPTRGYLSKPPPAWAQRAEMTPAGIAYPVQQYIADCIDCLFATLSLIAAEQLKEPTKRGLFLLANMSALEHFIADSDSESLASLLGRKGPQPPIMQALGEVGLQRFGKVMDAAFKLYLTEWNKLAPNLLDATMTNTAANAKLSGKDREAVKEKFRVFNAEFESLAERQKRFPISDAALRQRISQEVKKLIVPLYTRFYQKHRNGDFTKNISKYVKYTPAEIESAVSF